MNGARAGLIAAALLLSGGGGALRAEGYRAQETFRPGTVMPGINFQGKVYEQGALVALGSRYMKFGIYESSTTAFGVSRLWTSSPQKVEIQDGVFGAVLDIPFNALIGTKQKYIEVEVSANLEGDESYRVYKVLSPRQALLAVPYAMVARTVEGAVEISTGGFAVKTTVNDVDEWHLYVSSVTGRVGIGTTAPASRLQITGGEVMLGTTNQALSADDLFIKGNISVDGVAAFGKPIRFDVLGISADIVDGQLFVVGNGYVTADNEGRVGVGTTAPGAALHVHAAGIGPGVVLDHPASPRLVLTQSSLPVPTPVLEAGYDGSGGKLGTATGAGAMSLLTQGSPRLTATSAGLGRIGISTAVPETTLDVAATAQFGLGVAKSTFTSTGALQLYHTLEVKYGGTNLGAGTAGTLLVSNGAGAWTGVQMSSHATMDASGRLSLTPTGVKAGLYGSASKTTGFGVDAQGRLYAASSMTITANNAIGAGLLNGNIWVGDASGNAQEMAVGGDASLSNAGGLTLKTLSPDPTGTWHEVAVDSKGRITGHGSPTKLGDYGITDALTNAGDSTQSGYFGDIFLKDDTNPSHYLRLTVAEDYWNNRTLTLQTNNGDRVLMLNGDASVSGNNSGDQTINFTGGLAGSGTGSFSANLAPSGVTPGTYGDDVTIPQITVDNMGRLTSVVLKQLGGLDPVAQGTSLNRGSFWLGDTGSLAKVQSMSGDASLSQTGVLTLLTSGSAGTWHEVTVDARGLVTGHGTPTTLSAYGIADALSNSQTSSQSGYFGDIFLKDDTNPSHYLRLTVGEDYSGDHTLTLRTNGNFDRTLMVSGNATVSGRNTGDQSIVLDNLGDVTGSGTGTFSAYLKPLSPDPQGTSGSATNSVQLTVDSKGRLTAASSVAIGPGMSPQGATLASGQIWVGNGTAVARAITGDASLASNGNLTLASVVTAGTYRLMKVDSKGRIVAGSSAPTLLGDYSISDGLHLQTSSPGTPDSGNLNIDGSAVFAGNATVGGDAAVGYELSLNGGSGSNVLHNCTKVTSSSGTGTRKASCAGGYIVVSGGGTSGSDDVTESYPDSSTSWTFAGDSTGGTHTAYAVCCQY